MDQLPDRNAQIQALLIKCIEIEEGGDLQTALSFAQTALAEAQQANAIEFFAPVQVLLAKIHSRIGSYSDAISLAQQALDSATTVNTRVDALIVLGICLAETNNSLKSQQCFQSAVDLSRQNGYTLGLARALHNLAANIYLIRGQFTLALATMEESQRLRQQMNQPGWGLPFLQTHIYETTGNRKRARQSLDELLPLVKPGTRTAGGYFYLWARLALDEEELSRAAEYLRLALRIATMIGSPDLNIWVRCEYSRYYRLTGETASAITWASDAVQLAEHYQYEVLQGEALIELAHATWQNGSQEQALALLEKAGKILECHQAAFHQTLIALLQSIWLYETAQPGAESAWLRAARMILQGGFAFLLEKERHMAYPVLAAFMRSPNREIRQTTETLLQGLAGISPSPLKIFGLGEFSVWQGRRPIPDQSWQRRKAGELFRFLLLQPNYSAGKEQILEAIWPDHPVEAAAGLLHQSTSTLRHILEPDLPDKFPSRYLFVEGEMISFRLPEGSQIDFEDFESALPIAIKNRRIDPLNHALALYHNDLFPGDCYADWSTERRERLSDLYLHGMLLLGQLYYERGDYLQAVSCSRKVLAKDGWNEDAVYLGMQAYIGLNDIPHAVHLYQTLEKTLRKDLDLAPRAQLRELVRQIRGRSTPTR